MKLVLDKWRDHAKRGRRLAIIVLGLSLTGAHPQQRHVSQATVAIASPKSANFGPSATGTSELNAPCKNGEDRRSSELCAQWKAADAAGESSRWAYLTWLAGLAGLAVASGTLFAAMRASRWAKAAALHTEAGAKHSERSAKAAEEALEQSRLASRTDLRAWVSVDASLVEYKRTKDAAHFLIDINLSNIGKTPALDVAISHKIYPRISMVIDYGETPQLVKFPDYPMAPLMPNGTTKQRFGLQIKNEQIEGAIEIAAKERCAVMVVIDLIAYYRTVFDEIGTRERTTSIRYTIHPDISAELEHAWRTIGLRWLSEQGRSGAGLRFSHDKSAPAHLS